MNFSPHFRKPSEANYHFASLSPFVLIFVVLAGLSLWELRFQDGGRVFIIGENLWAGAQKRAALCLLSYADRRSEQDLRCFREEIDVAVGDMQARIELDSPRRSYAVISDGLVRGRNRAQDVPTAIVFYRIAPWNPETEKSIDIWRASDRYVLRLIAIAKRLEQTDRASEREELRREILDIDTDLTGQQRDFALHLNNGMHFLSLGLCMILGVAALILISFAVFASRRMFAVRKSAQEQVQYLAYYDSLTNLPNRAFLGDQLAAMLSKASGSHERVAILFVDLDRFKLINDSLGHSVGDQILQEVAKRLKDCVRDSDVLARVGGDEFLIAVPSIESIEGAKGLAERVLKAMTADFHHHEGLFRLSCSIGISLFPDHGLDGETLIRHADAAMYCSKEHGRNTCCLFAEEMNSAIAERLTLENDLRAALSTDELYLVHQPQINIATGKIAGTEVLLRWRHSQAGHIPPDRFIRVAENSGLILPIGEWVLRTACMQAKKWQDQGLPVIPIAVNVSAVQFRHEGFCEMIRNILDETGFDPALLELELTESVLLSNEDVMLKVMKDLKAMGLSLAIDDFGTGYSSLSYLRQFPVSKLKIDRSFISDVPSNSDAAAIATAIISLGKNLNLTVIAEGVETESQLAFLRAQSCDGAQGYYFSKPVCSARLVEMLAEENSRTREENSPTHSLTQFSGPFQVGLALE